MAKVIFTDFKAKKVDMVVNNEELELFTTVKNDDVDYSVGLRLVVDNSNVSTPAPAPVQERDYLTPLFEAISTSDEVMTQRGYFNFYNYEQSDKIFVNSVETSLEKLKRAQNLISEQIYLMQELLKDSQESLDLDGRKPAR